MPEKTLTDVFSSITPYFTAAFAGTVTWLLTRKKYSAETKKIAADARKSEIDAVEAIVNMWKEAALDFQGQVKTLSGEMRELRETNRALNARLESIEKHFQTCDTCPIRLALTQPLQSERP